MVALNFGKLHALIVDDFENFRSTLNSMLMDIGVGSVNTAISGEEAIRSCKQHAYDLILCDHNLGKGKTGQQVLEELRTTPNLCSDSLFVLISAENSKHIVMAAYDYEPDAYLAKPITTQSLSQRLLKLFEQRVVLKPILQARQKANDEEAIRLCVEHIESGGRQSNSCQKILGQLYLTNQRNDEAEALYRSVLDNRELEWAQLGMARTKFQQGDWLSAQQWLEGILQANPLCMKAYDLQADIYRAQGEGSAQMLQDVLVQATFVSPLSILRQQALGEVAQQNNDLLVAAGALRKAVRLGENSCFDKPDIHMKFAQATVDLSATDDALARPLLSEAVKSVGEIETRFGKSPSTKACAQFLESQLFTCMGNERKAQEIFTKALEITRTLSNDEALNAEIEMIRSLRTMGKDEEARVQLSLLSEKYAGDEKALEKLDVLQDEPHSEKNKQMVAEINKRGIAAYNAKNFTAAADAFATALQKLPNHIGLRLNFVQALLDEVKLVFNQSTCEKIDKTLNRTAVIISQKHPQYRRYRQLQDVFNSTIKEKGLIREVG